MTVAMTRNEQKNAHRRALRTKRKDAGLCTCGQKPEPGKARCGPCRERNNRDSRASHKKRRAAARVAYDAGCLSREDYLRTHGRYVERAS
jgi:hypothetical protein